MEKQVPESWILLILDGERSGSHYEKFAVSLVGTMETAPIVSTSTSYDLGRDGRSVQPGRMVVVMASTEDTVKKFESDATEVCLKVPRPKKVYCLSSSDLSEDRIEKINTAVRGVFGDDELPVQTNGRRQIADLVSTHPMALKLFSSHYSAEVDALARFYQSENSERVEIRCLSLALGTFGDMESMLLREEFGRRAVLLAISTKALRVDQVQVALDRVFGIGTFCGPMLERCLRQAQHDGLIESLGGNYVLTPHGRSALDDLRLSQGADELKGVHVTRKAIESSLGQQVTDSQWKAIWRDLTSELAQVFYTRGKELVDAISRLLDSGRDVKKREDYRELLNIAVSRVAKAVAEPAQRSQMEQAVHDALLPGSPAFDWLTEVAGRFAGICSLGFAPDVYKALESMLSGMRFFFDSDVVITYQCAHEPDHALALSVRELSKRTARPIAVTHAVAEEVARHAMKAHVDYEKQVAASERPLRWFDLESLESAYTREFESLRLEGKVASSEWKRFIERYTGPLRYTAERRLRPDTGRMRQILSGDGFNVLPASHAYEIADKDALTDALYEHSRNRPRRQRLPGVRLPEDYEDTDVDDFDSRARDKARLDAELLRAVAREVESSEGKGMGERFALVSNAWILRNLPSKAMDELPSKVEVITLAEAGYLASLLPGAVVGVSTMKGLLFDGQFRTILKKNEQKLLSLVRTSRTASVNGASRGVLILEFSESLLSQARANGESQRALYKRAAREPVLFARLAMLALDAHGIQDPIERAELLAELKTLQEKLTQ